MGALWAALPEVSPPVSMDWLPALPVHMAIPPDFGTWPGPIAAGAHVVGAAAWPVAIGSLRACSVAFGVGPRQLMIADPLIDLLDSALQIVPDLLYEAVTMP